jgi:ABC-type Zn uptake system ZnuABC Zn-binding protein ZnuA
LPLLRADGAGHRHGEWDPHVWHDVSLAERIVETVRDALASADPAHREVYEDNAAAYAGRLRALDVWVEETVACCTTEAGRRVATAHASFNYLAARYGFVMLATPTGSISTAAEPSARQIATVVEQVRAAGVRAVFPESTTGQRTMLRVALEAGVALAAPLYADALGPPGSPGESYVGLVTHNVSTIVGALNGGAQHGDG